MRQPAGPGWEKLALLFLALAVLYVFFSALQGGLWSQEGGGDDDDGFYF